MTYFNFYKNPLSKKLWKDNDGKDFTFIVEGKLEIKAHKQVLAISSPIFRNLVKSENSIEINGYDFSIVEKAIRFYYDFLKKQSVEDYITLMKFAHQYEFQELKSSVESGLIEKLSVDNVCELANLSMECELAKLRKECCKLLSNSMKWWKNSSIPDVKILDNDFAKECLNQAFGVVEIKKDEKKETKIDLSISFFVGLFVSNIILLYIFFL